jgi:hypothetical protein
MTDEQQIRDLIERWALAVHDGDMPTVLADHDADIVMFDVPPPFRGVRGLEAYRDSWPVFFRLQAAGAVFDIEALDVISRPWTWSRGPTSPSPTGSCGAAHPRSSSASPTSYCDSPSACARSTAGGS